MAEQNSSGIILTQASLMAEVILSEISGATDGHCLRINNLDLPLCQEIAQITRQRWKRNNAALIVNVLAPPDMAAEGLVIRSDKAIEIRNRKLGVFCLFVPAGSDNLTASSLGNSFAELNGADLVQRSLRLLLNGDGIRDTKRAVSQVNQIFLNTSLHGRPSEYDRLDFALAAAKLEQGGKPKQIGRELWRIGLLPDHSSDYLGELRKNRSLIAAIARPRRITAPLSERIKNRGLNPESARSLEASLRGERLENAKAWTQRLGNSGLSFDTLVFLDAEVASDIESVAVVPFCDARGALVSRNAGGLWQSSPGTPLFGVVGDGKKISVKWESTPTKTTVAAWRVDIVPSDEQRADEVDLYDLPGVSVRKGTARKATIKLDLGQLGDDDIPMYPVRMKVAALSSTGEQLVDRDNNEIVGLSEEFYLTKDDDPDASEGSHTRERSSNARSLSEGLLTLVVKRGVTANHLESPQRLANGPTTIFTMRANDREQVSLIQSTALFALQKQILQAPNELGILSVHYDEDRLLEANDAQKVVSDSEFNSDAYRKFITARRAFFRHVSKPEIDAARDVVESVDWSNEGLRSHVQSYAEAWANWLNQAEGTELHFASSVDTLRFAIQVGDQPDLEALIALPTHPLRALWLASHSALVDHWTNEILKRGAKPTSLVDLDLVLQLAPSNLPMLFHHPHLPPSEPVAFFRNLDFGHGVAIRTKRSNEASQFERLQKMLGLPSISTIIEAPQQQRAALTLKRFLDSHPYADPLRISLIHPDNGLMLRNTLADWKRQERRERVSDATDDFDDIPPLEVPRVEVTVYHSEFGVADDSINLGAGTWHQGDEVSAVQSDHLQPAFSVRSLLKRDLLGAGSQDSNHQYHLAIVQDLGEPTPVGIVSPDEDDRQLGLPLFGLIARYQSTLRENSNGPHVEFRIDAAPPAESHPADKRFGRSISRALSASMASAARLLGDTTANSISLNVSLGANEAAIVEKIHALSDWVITIDRFIGPEIFDQPDLHQQERTYILDASPTFQDGMSRQSFVTTSSREEVELILLRAMGKLGFGDLHESVGHLLSSLRKVSGRLVLDALQSNTRAAEVVGIGAVVLWLQARDELADTVIVPIDSHIDLFSSGSSDAASANRRADLALFRFKTPKKLEIRIVEVKSRSTISEDIVDVMADQMRASGNAIDERLRSDRVDSSLQRSQLAQVLRFYLDRSVRYRTLDGDAERRFRNGLANLERGAVDFDRSNQGFVIGLGEISPPPPIAVDIFTTVTFLSIPDIAQAAANGTTISGGRTSSVEPVWPSAETPEHDDQNQDGLQKPETDVPASTVATAIPEPSTDDNQDVLLGNASGRPIVWQPRVAGSPHVFVLGIPGQGKSVTIDRILTELNKSQTPSFILDFHGTFADTNTSALRDTRLTLLDAADGLPFSPFSLEATVKEPQVNQQAREISNIVDHVFGLGDIQRDAFYTTLRDLYIRRGFGRTRGVDTVPEPVRLADVEKALARKEKEQGVKNLIARTRALFDFDLFTAGYDEDRFDELLRNGVVIGLNHLGGDEIALSLSSFLLRRLYFSITKWPVADRLRLVIVLDEAHRLTRDITLPKIMKEARKFGVAVVIASQGLADFHSDIVSNAGTKISFRVNYPDSRKVAGFFRGGPGDDLPAVLEGLGVGQALVQTPEMTRAAMTSMFRPGD